MGIKTKLLFFLFSLFLVSSCLVSASVEARDPQRGESRDPQREYQQCQQQCQQRPGQEEQQQCQQRCEEQYREQQQQQQHRFILLNTEEESRDPAKAYQQCQQQCGGEHGHLRQSCLRRCDEQYQRDNIPDDPAGDLARALRQCEQHCSQTPQGQPQQQCQQQCQCLDECKKYKSGPLGAQWQCQQRCLRQSEEQQGQPGGRQGDNLEDESQQGSQGEQSRGSGQQEENENPYLFRQERFQTKIKSQEGKIRVLERFNSRSILLKGIKNYRISIFEANPNTVMLPNHWDANSVCMVLNGRGAIVILNENNKETYNLERGDVFRIQAGVTVYSMNSDNNEKLIIAELTIPVNTPGQFESFHTVGAQDQESYFRAFSDEILQSAFNVPSDQVRKLFEGQKNQGVFVKASQQQIRAMSRGSSGMIPIPWPFGRGGGESQYTYNLLNQSPIQSSRYGQLYEANPNDFRQFQDLDVAVSFANITRGGMLGPFYNSRSTKIAMVVRGEGSFEMACPHMSQQQQGQQRQEQGQQGQESSPQGGQRGSGSTSYQKVRARVSQGDVYVVPAGHPIATVASNNQNLEVVCFEINAQNNKRIPLAGNNNILKQMDREAKELSFNVPARQVDQILNKQQESWFFPGPQQREQQRGQDLA
ncbi:hypothetical protein ACHQM5_027474 [Ranunculus cassubicifolius]